MREGSTLLIPDLSPPLHLQKKKKTCLDFDQDKNIAGQGRFLKPKRSGLGPIRREGAHRLAQERKHCPQWGPAQAGSHPRSALMVCVLQQAERHMKVCG